MEEGLKNLNQAGRAVQRKAGTYDNHEESGIGISDLDEEDITEDLEASPLLAYPQNPRRGPSIPSLLREPYSYQKSSPYPYSRSQNLVSNANNLSKSLDLDEGVEVRITSQEDPKVSTQSNETLGSPEMTPPQPRVPGNSPLDFGLIGSGKTYQDSAEKRSSRDQVNR